MGMQMGMENRGRRLRRLLAGSRKGCEVRFVGCEIVTFSACVWCLPLAFFFCPFPFFTLEQIPCYVYVTVFFLYSNSNSGSRNRVASFTVRSTWEM
jgi:hypothetical protein